MPFIEALRQLSFSVGKPVNPPPLLLGFLSFTASYIDVGCFIFARTRKFLPYSCELDSCSGCCWGAGGILFPYF